MKILIIEDEVKLAQSLRKGLTEQSFVVDVVHSGDEGLDLALTGNYSAILLDVSLPQKDGFQILKELRQRSIHTPVLFLTAKDAITDRVQGLNLGADDYIVKPFAFSELLARIQAVCRRKGPYEGMRLQVADLELDLSHREVARGGQKIDLRPKEFSILQYLMENQGRVVTRAMLTERIWDYSFVSGSNVIDVHVKRLREKIDAQFPKKLIKTVKGVGYILG